MRIRRSSGSIRGSGVCAFTRATILVAGILAVANGLGDDGFDFTSGGDWKAIAGAALAAMIMAGGAFVQRLVNPPRGQ